MISVEIVPNREITTKIEKTSFSRPWPWVCLLNEPNAAASTAPTLIRHCSGPVTIAPSPPPHGSATGTSTPRRLTDMALVAAVQAPVDLGVVEDAHFVTSNSTPLTVLV